jgi:hypothetical protein
MYNIDTYNSCKCPTWRTIPFSICLFQFSTCFEQPRAHHQENQLYQYNIWYVSLWPSSMEVGKFLPDLHTRQSPSHSDTYQMLYWYTWFSWWWARVCSKHEESWNKHIEKELCVKFVICNNYTEMAARSTEHKKIHTYSRYRDMVTRLTVRGSSPIRYNRFLSSFKRLDWPWGPSNPPLNWYLGTFPRGKRPEREVDNHSSCRD